MDGRITGVDAAAMLTLTLVALSLRVPVIGQSLGGDEIHTYGVVHGRSLGGMLSELRHGGEVAPPLYFLLAWAGAKTADPTLWMRMPSLLFSTAAVPLTYLLGCRTVGRPAAALGAALLALSPCALAYAVEARPYATLMFLVVLSSLLLLHAVQSQRRGMWALYALSAIAILYTHYFGVFAVAAQALWALWMSPQRWRTAVVTYGLIAVALIPWAPSIADQRPNHADILAYVTLTPDWVGMQSAKVLPGHPGFPGKDIPGTAAQAAFIVVIGIAALLAFLNVVRRRGWRNLRASSRSLPALLAAGIGLGLLLLSLAGDNTFQVKYLVAGLPAFVLVLGTLVTAMPRPLAWAGAAVILGVLVVGSVKTFDAGHTHAPFREAANFIASRAEPGDAVIDSSGFSIGPRLRRYLRPLEIYLDRREYRVLASGDADRVFAQPHRGTVFVVGLQREDLLSVARPASEDGLCQLDRRVFAGSSPVAVLTYQSAQDPRTRLLEGARGAEILLPSGTRLPVRPGATRGFVDQVDVQRRKVFVNAWAIDGAHEPAGCLLVFDRDRHLLAFGLPGYPRPDVAKSYGQSADRAGFQLVVSGPPAQRVKRLPDIRVFAVAGGAASELQGAAAPG